MPTTPNEQQNDQQWDAASQAFATFVVATVAALWLAGMTLSFSSVKDAAEPYVGGYAPIVPLGVDLGIIAFTGLDLLMARMRMRTRWLRFVPWGLVAATIYLNVADETDWLGRVIHAVLPIASVVVVEAAAHVIKVKAGLAGSDVETGPERRERLGLALWILSPFSTLALYRRMMIARAATDAYVDARIVAARWRDEKGLFWRWRVSREQRVLYRYGRLRPTGVVVDVPAAAVPPSPPPTAALEAPAAVPEAAPVGQDDDPLLPRAIEICRDVGQPLSGKRLNAELRRRDGKGVGSDRANKLAAAVKAAVRAGQNGSDR